MSDSTPDGVPVPDHHDINRRADAARTKWLSPLSKGGKPRPEPNVKFLDDQQLEKAREQALRAWRSAAKDRELSRIGNSPNGDKDWLRESGIKDGEWFTTMKPRFEQLMQPGHTVKTRIWAAGVLATDGFRGELAVKLVRGNKLKPLTSNDIRKKLNDAAEKWTRDAGLDLTDVQKNALHLSKQDVRRGLAGLEIEGTALRTLRDGATLRALPPAQEKGLQEGDILLFFFFRPLPPEPAAVASKCLPLFVSGSPLNKIARTLKLIELDLPPQTVANSDYLIAEFDAAESDYR